MIVIGLLLLYVLLIVTLIIGYSRVKTQPLEFLSPVQSFSVIIPFRNEALHLPALLDSLRLLDYPVSLLEIFLVNDDSSDTSVQLITAYIEQHDLTHIQILENIRLSGSPKKDAIRTAIAVAKHPWIITTDADCTLPKKWLQVLDSCIQRQAPKMVAGPLALTPNIASSRLRYAVESLDIHSLLGATIGAFGLGNPIMANGAHLAYRKDIFHLLKGFDGNDHMASGDDQFLLEKFVAHDPQAVHYLKNSEAIVRTAPQETWRSFVSQRQRWAAKASRYQSAFAKAVGILVFIGNLATLVAYGLLIYHFWAGASGIPIGFLLGAILLKYLVDGLLIFKALRFTGTLRSFSWYPLIAIFYPMVTLVIAILAFTRSYRWKGRTFKQ